MDGSQGGICREASHLTGQLLRQPAVVLVDEGDELAGGCFDSGVTGSCGAASGSGNLATTQAVVTRLTREIEKKAKIVVLIRAV